MPCAVSTSATGYTRSFRRLMSSTAPSSRSPAFSTSVDQQLSRSVFRDRQRRCPRPIPSFDACSSAWRYGEAGGGALVFGNTGEDPLRGGDVGAPRVRRDERTARAIEHPQ